MYYYTYNTHILAAAGIVGILVIAVVLTALLAVLVLPKHKDGKLPAFFQLLFIKSQVLPAGSSLRSRSG